MFDQRAASGVCALFFLAGCGNGTDRLSDREWNAIFNEGVQASYTNCQKVSVSGAPGYHKCDGDQPVEPYIDHLFK